ncbi:hypothetical protein AJ80_02600 [Polytolypa hystricis UAMH7299]|uniref:DASH complex subunit DUO1 n=1 Tax=Polytolypa hystricis (strain UAMH7299) TaxID=1447883 RepID=A0A2B7YRV7_POLH7|nr:hypothetical protein AJ80_02600 [Polytolypa hystricis UAMH7299]
MSMSSARAEMEKLQLSDEDEDALWASPSNHRKTHSASATATDSARAAQESAYSRNSGTQYDRKEAREASLRTELQTVRNINQVIEGVLESLERAKDNMGNVSRTVQSADTLLNTWTRILAQTEQNQRLILNPSWQGATQDMADIETEAIQKQQEAERREQELQQRREALARKAEEDQRKRETAATRGTRGTTRTRSRVLGRTPSISTSRSGVSGQGGTRGTGRIPAPTTGSTRGTTGTRRPTSEIPRGTGIARARTRPRAT